MDQIGSNRPKWTVWAKLDGIDQSGLNGPNGSNWTEVEEIGQNILNMTELTKVDRMGRIELN